MSKSISFKNVKAGTADDWVSNNRPDEDTKPSKIEAAKSVDIKRFTIDVPRSLHIRIKTACARRGLKMADVMRELLEREFPV